MWQQLLQLWQEGFTRYGTDAIGYLVVGICFGMFYVQGTQRTRFRLIGRGCRILGFGSLLFVILPSLKLLNPQFEVTQTGYRLLGAWLGAIASSYLWTSLFVLELGKKQLKALLLALMVIQITVLTVLTLFTEFNFLYLLFAVVWFVVAISFYRLPTVGKTALFANVADCLLGLGIFYLIRLWGLFPKVPALPSILFGVLAFIVVMAQIRFMQVNTTLMEEQLEFEKKRRTLFWDIAPFPILVSKLLDDSVLYINPIARETLKLSGQDIGKFRLTDYFARPEKRNDLVALVRQNRIVDSFEVEMRSPRSGEKMWLDLSARVVELDGELALYVNLHDMTEQKETEEKLFKQASTDTLTGLYNRRQFEAMVAQSIASAKRYQTPYCVMMCDIDHFKMVNDTYGHEAGDIVLKGVADLMRSSFRASDIVGRYGGEEFVVFLTNTDVAGAQVAAEKFRLLVEQAHIEAEGKHIPVTISLGITNTQNNDLLRLVKEADLALYYSKEHGRNQVSVYHPQMEQERDE
ncbi:MAG: sensor domain-containing diguanylate cyclase [Alphaproteobacteria bacterium]|nr:sensor domain-containing diguanylate cyclase [Alphaproteobacteria bacterium]